MPRGKKNSWTKLAQQMARDAFETSFETHRGIWVLTDPAGQQALCVYNNHPYSDDPDRRDQETARLRERLRAEGIEELGYATYPLKGKDAGYTYAMVLRADGSKSSLVNRLLIEIRTQPSELFQSTRSSKQHKTAS